MDIAGSQPSTVGDADSIRHISDAGSTSRNVTCNLPARPVWMQEDSLLVYSPPGLHTSNKANLAMYMVTYLYLIIMCRLFYIVNVLKFVCLTPS